MAYSNRVFGGYISEDGEVVKLSATILESNGKIAERNVEGHFLPEYGGNFSISFTNNILRSAKVTIKRYDDKAVIAEKIFRL